MSIILIDIFEHGQKHIGAVLPSRAYIVGLYLNDSFSIKYMIAYKKKVSAAGIRTSRLGAKHRLLCLYCSA